MTVSDRAYRFPARDKKGGDIGILMSDAMALAAREGRKTQTRRVIRPQPNWDESRQLWQWPVLDIPLKDEGLRRAAPSLAPYQVGDILWVRECHLVVCGCEECESGWDECKSPKVIYRADGTDISGYCGTDDDCERSAGWTPSIHMPRWAARTFLEVTDVQVQRIHGISEDDARAEGFEISLDDFASYWNELYPKHPWASNPFVFAYAFKLTEGPA